MNALACFLRFMGIRAIGATIPKITPMIYQVPILFAALAPFAAAQTIGNWTIHQDIFGTDLYEMGGSVIKSVGEIDGDGHDDIMLGAPYSEHLLNYTGGVFLYSGLTHQLIHHVPGTKDDQLLGMDVQGMGDIDGDGHADFLAGSPGVSRIGFYSGAAGTIIYEQEDLNQPWFRDSLANIPDYDGDGVRDFLVNLQDESWPQRNTTGGIAVHSGINGDRIEVIPPPWNSYSFGSTLEECGDLDGDGNPDVMMKFMAADLSNWVVVHSSANLQEILRFPIMDQSPSLITDAGDLNHDGVNDILVAAPYAEINGKKAVGRVVLHSGNDGSELTTMDGTVENEMFGYSALGNVDLDLDGYTDLIIASPRYTWGVSLIRSYSGRYGKLMSTYRSPDPGDFLGISMTALGDTDGDGYTEIAVTAPYAVDPANGLATGAIFIADLD